MQQLSLKVVTSIAQQYFTTGQQVIKSTMPEESKLLKEFGNNKNYKENSQLYCKTTFLGLGKFANFLMWGRGNNQ